MNRETLNKEIGDTLRGLRKAKGDPVLKARLAGLTACRNLLDVDLPRTAELAYLALEVRAGKRVVLIPAKPRLELRKRILGWWLDLWPVWA